LVRVASRAATAAAAAASPAGTSPHAAASWVNEENLMIQSLPWAKEGTAIADIV